MEEDLVKKIGDENLNKISELGFSYSLNTKVTPYHITFKYNDIEIRVHNHLGIDNGKYVILISQPRPFERFGLKGYGSTETRLKRIGGGQILSISGNFETILKNLMEATDRCRRSQYC